MFPCSGSEFEAGALAVSIESCERRLDFKTSVSLYREQAHGHPVKKGGHGKGNWGKPEDDYKYKNEEDVVEEEAAEEEVEEEEEGIKFDDYFANAGFTLNTGTEEKAINADGVTLGKEFKVKAKTRIEVVAKKKNYDLSTTVHANLGNVAGTEREETEGGNFGRGRGRGRGGRGRGGRRFDDERKPEDQAEGEAEGNADGEKSDATRPRGRGRGGRGRGGDRFDGERPARGGDRDGERPARGRGRGGFRAEGDRADGDRPARGGRGRGRGGAKDGDRPARDGDRPARGGQRGGARGGKSDFGNRGVNLNDDNLFPTLGGN